MLSRLKYCSPLILALACIGSIIFSFHTPLSHLHRLWLDNDNGYSHGYLVLAISLYLLFQNRHKYLEKYSRPSIICFTLFLGNLTAYCISDYLSIVAIQIPLLVTLLWFSLGSIGGLGVLKVTAFPVLFLFFATPIWDLLLPYLQGLTVYISKNTLQAIGIAAFYHGDTVTLPYGDVVIEESCSGLRYLTISLTLSALYYHLNFRGHPFRGSLMIASAISLALLSNWVRVTYIIYVAYTSEMQDPLVASHYNFGWILYSFSLIPFFLIARYLQPSSPPINQNTAKTQNISEHCTSSSLAGLMCIGLILAAPHYTEKVKLDSANKSISAPQAKQPWQQKAAYIAKNQWQATFYNYDYSEHQIYSHPDTSLPVRLDIYGYLSQNQGKELISDRHYAASRQHWRVINQPEIEVKGLNIEPKLVSDIKGKRLIWHWYNVASINTNNKYLAKIYELKNLIQSEKSASAAVIISAECTASCNDAESSLRHAIDKLNLL